MNAFQDAMDQLAVSANLIEGAMNKGMADANTTEAVMDSILGFPNNIR